MFLEEPISRGVDKAINACLDKIEKSKKINSKGGEER
jgi:hypothetical protein